MENKIWLFTCIQSTLCNHVYIQLHNVHNIFSLLGQYWQVSDGPSSSLTLDTDNVPLGSYGMDIVIYHYRSKEKFIPLGYASTQFSVTGEDAINTNSTK